MVISMYRHHVRWASAWEFPHLRPTASADPEPRMVAASTVTPTPAPAHADPTTAPQAQATPFAVPAKAATPLTDPEAPPAKTGDAEGGSKAPSPDIASTDPSPPASPVDGCIVSPINKGDPSADTKIPSLADPANPASAPDSLVASPINRGDFPADTKSPSPTDPVTPAHEAGDPPANSVLSSSTASDPSPRESPDPPPLPKALTQASPWHRDKSQSQAQGLGAIIYNALGRIEPQVGGNTNEASKISPPPSGVQQVTIHGSDVLSINPSEVELERTTYSAGGPTVTILNSVFTLIPQPKVNDNIANNEPNDSTDSLPPALDALTLAGHTLVPNPSAVVIDGSTLLAGGRPLTIPNTPISLGTSGLLILGSSSTTLSH